MEEEKKEGVDGWMDAEINEWRNEWIIECEWIGHGRIQQMKD